MKKNVAILYKGRLLDERFEGVIKAGQWAYGQGFSPDDYKTVELLPDGTINHRAIIQVFNCSTGHYVLENHYTTCGLFHLPMERYEKDKEYFAKKYSHKKYIFNAWIQY